MSEILPSIDADQATRALCVGPLSSTRVVPEDRSAATDDRRSPPQFDVGSPDAVVCRADIARDDLTGLSLGPYALGPKIGGGGMGKVFAARHVLLDKRFAIKFVGVDASGCPEARRRFEQEVKALGQLDHPHIVRAVDAGCVDGLQYLATDWVDGVDLGRLVELRGAIGWSEACELVRQAAEGLAYSHDRGFLHRDVKPSNLILDRTGVVKILDFGLVRSAACEQNMTVAGEMLGSIDFVAPEQAEDARQVDQRSDIYGLGCTLLYLVSGRSPFGGVRYATAAAKIKGHLFDRPEWFANVPCHMPAELPRLLQRMLAKAPAERFQNAAEAAEALRPLAARAQLSLLIDASSSSGPTSAGDSGPRNFPKSQDDWRSQLTRWLAASSGLAFAGLVAWLGLATLPTLGLPERPTPAAPTPAAPTPAPIAPTSTHTDEPKATEPSPRDAEPSERSQADSLQTPEPAQPLVTTETTETTETTKTTQAAAKLEPPPPQGAASTGSVARTAESSSGLTNAASLFGVTREPSGTVSAAAIPFEPKRSAEPTRGFYGLGEPSSGSKSRHD